MSELVNPELLQLLLNDLGKLHPDDRRKILTRLLEVEVEQRETEESSGIRVTGYSLDGEIFLEASPDSDSCLELSGINGWYTAEEVEHLFFGLAAALVKKRRRESEVRGE